MAEKVEERMAQRQQEDKERPQDMEKHPRCGLLPSPEELAIGPDNPGQDASDTRKDFDRVHQWLKKIEALNEKFYNHYKPEHSGFLDEAAYGSLIQLAFSTSFDAMRHTYSPELPEYVLWYYVGHGYDPNGDSSGKSSIPNLEKVGYNNDYNKIADEFAPKELQDQLVKGGELCLHHVGYCGLYGLLKPWIAAVKSESRNKPLSEKKNKHLIIILDSCYSGVMAKDLKELNKKEGPWNQNDCTVTIQAACSPNEQTYGGYFTPGFLTLNQNQSLLKELKKEWKLMEKNTKDCFRSLPQPSPKVVTTRKDVEDEPLTLEFHFNNDHHITLFPDPGFFKFCSISIFEHEEEDLREKRVLDVSKTQTFMSSTNFTVLDFKLKTLQNGPFADHPMGLFLIQDPNNPNLAVCAHVHFNKNDTSKVGMINLVHHKVPPQQNVIYVEDHDGFSNSQIKKGRHKIGYACVPRIPKPQNPSDWEYWSWNTANPPNSVPMSSHITDPDALRLEVGNGARLVDKCHNFVESKEPGRWMDTSRWNQKSADLSYSGKFRRNERSEWMKRYSEKYDR